LLGDICVEISLELSILTLAEILKEPKQRLEDHDDGFDFFEAERTMRKKVATSKNHCETLQDVALLV
jgi:hypothetical protein